MTLPEVFAAWEVGEGVSETCLTVMLQVTYMNVSRK